MALELDAIPILDNHCHSLLRAQPQDDAAFRIHLTESYYPEIARDHVPHSLFYLWAIRELAAFLGCEPTPDAVHATRRERGVERLATSLLQNPLSRIRRSGCVPRSGGRHGTASRSHLTARLRRAGSSCSLTFERQDSVRTGRKDARYG